MKTLLERHFDTAFDAPDGIKRLRELILTLAMQGKLVKQDPNDPPASELLKEIESEKKRLVKAGKIKQPTPQPPLKAAEAPYELPKGWEWVTLSAITLINPRNDIADSTLISFVPMTLISTGFEGTHRQEERVWAEVKQGFTHFAEGDIGVAKITPCFENSKACVFSNLKNNAGAGTTELHIVRPVAKTLSPRYVLAYLKSPQFLLVGSTKMTGTAGQKRLPKDFLESNPFPLPPLPEQHRIVAKIDQLMAHCDALEKLRAERDQKRLVVHAAAIKQLLDPSFASSRLRVQPFLFSHFPELYAVKENVTELRKAILQLAVMGKLVPQDLQDQPASELLKEIDAEKNRLFKTGAIKQPKPLSPIKPEEAPYELPKIWQWVRLGEIGVWKSGTTPNRSNSTYYGGSIPWVKSGEVKQGLIKQTQETITELALEECSLSLNPKGSVLVAMYGANIGEVGILDIEATTNQAVCACQVFSKLNAQYLLNLIAALKSYFISQGAGAAQPNISREKIVATPFPLPPLAEQNRIVAKIDQLMALCDAMENQITSATAKQTTLLTALMAQQG